MSGMWKIIILLTLSVNLACLVVVARMGERQVEDQRETVDLFRKLSVDQQAIRRELHEVRQRSDDFHP